MDMKNINKKVMEKVDSYNYTENVNSMVTELRNSFKNKKTNSMVYLSSRKDIDNDYMNEEEVISDVANAIIEYRIKEKAYVALIKEGVIYPINICSGKGCVSLANSNIKGVTSYNLNPNIEFNRLIFDEFIIF